MSKTYALPREVVYKLNVFENGWLHGAMFPYMERMKKECPIMWLQFQINFSKAYANSEGHPMQKQAKKDVKKYQKQMLVLQKKRGEINES